MYCAVILSDFRENLLIPIEWVKDLTSSKVLNYGFSRHDTYIVYYDGCGGIPLEPDFNDVEIIRDGEFRPDASVGYYEAYILACCGKYCSSQITSD